jgi:hypothetical protein
MTPISFIKDFSKRNLSGWKKNDVVVSNNPDPRAMDFEFRSRIRHNFPSQRSPFHRCGYISFFNRKRFDLANQTIGYRKKYLFLFHEVRIYWERFDLEQRIAVALRALPEADRHAAIVLITEGARQPSAGRVLDSEEALRALSAVGLADLQQLEALLAQPTAALDATSQAA